jgi:hypothetical protein
VSTLLFLVTVSISLKTNLPTNTPYAFRHGLRTEVTIMENSDFDIEPFDATETIEKINRKKKKRRNLGVVLLFAPLLCFVLLIGLFPEAGDILFISGLSATMALAFLGMIFLAFAALPKAYIRGVSILGRLSPLTPIITEDYAVLKIENTIAFALRKAPYGLFFVSTAHSESIPAIKIHVPMNFFKWSSLLHIEGLRVHHQNGTFSIPTPEGEIRSIEGALLLVPIRGGSYMLHVPDFSRKQLLAVAEYASRLASEGTVSDTFDTASDTSDQSSGTFNDVM